MEELSTDGARARALVTGVQAAAGALAVLYAVLAVLHPRVTDGPEGPVLAVLAATTAAAVGALWFRCHRSGLRPNLAAHAAGALAAGAAANSLVHLAVTADPVQTTNVMLVVVAVGAVVDHPRLAAGVAGASLLGVAAVMAGAPPDAAWGHFVFGLLSASVLAIVLRRVRQRGLTALEQARATAARLATHDPLTGLLNRRGLELFAERALLGARRSTSPVALLFLDLDGLKGINDTLGHAAGDAHLTEAAHRLRSAFRQADAVARIGGDEFVVLLVGAGPEEAVRLAERARQHLGRRAASVGVAVAVDPPTASLDGLLEQADLSMYRDKQARKDAGLPAAVDDVDGAATSTVTGWPFTASVTASPGG